MRDRIITIAIVALLGLVLWLCGALGTTVTVYGGVALFWLTIGSLALTFLAVCTLVHELGHAVAALLVGFRVRQIVLGMGAVIGRWRLAGIEVEIRGMPVCGAVCPEPRGELFLRLRYAIICLAGPIAEIAFLGLIVHGLNIMPESSLEMGAIRAGVRVAVVVAFTRVGLSLLPWTPHTPLGDLSTDGLLVLRALFSSRGAGLPRKSMARVAEETRYAVEAFAFVLDGLHSSGLAHLDGRSLCWRLRDRALESYGHEARATLRSWGVESCEDFGRIVFRMVETGWIDASAQDSLDDFNNVYSFEDALA